MWGTPSEKSHNSLLSPIGKEIAPRLPYCDGHSQDQQWDQGSGITTTQHCPNELQR